MASASASIRRLRKDGRLALPLAFRGGEGRFAFLNHTFGRAA